MNNSASFKIVAAAILAGVLLAFVNPAHARESVRSRTGTWQSSRGGSGTFNETTTRGNGQLQRQANWTNQNGGSGQSTTTRTWDKASGTGTLNSSTTLANGKTATRTADLTKIGDGTSEAKGTETGFNGKSSTFDVITSKTANGSTTQGTIVGPNGKDSTVNSQFTKLGNGETTRDTTVTGPNGKTDVKDVSTTVNPDGTGTRTVEITRPDGQTESRTETFTQTSGSLPSS